ncbi:MAG: hypothetical protein GWN86_06935 [Desulfobacterales bacterium]|nr:hypothetical protein [Desulfobacterales bacterium]
MGGRFYVLHGDLVSHFLAVRAEIDLNLNSNQLWQCDVWGPEADEIAMLDAVPLTWVEEHRRNMKQHPGVRYDYENMPVANTHWRLCADKELCAWRARDEATGQLWEVLDYRGLIKGSKFKPRETHIFHQGKQEVIDGVFWFK